QCVFGALSATSKSVVPAAFDATKKLFWCRAPAGPAGSSVPFTLQYNINTTGAPITLHGNSLYYTFLNSSDPLIAALPLWSPAPAPSPTAETWQWQSSSAATLWQCNSLSDAYGPPQSNWQGAAWAWLPSSEEPVDTWCPSDCASILFGNVSRRSCI